MLAEVLLSFEMYMKLTQHLPHTPEKSIALSKVSELSGAGIFLPLDCECSKNVLQQHLLLFFFFFFRLTQRGDLALFHGFPPLPFGKQNENTHTGIYLCIGLYYMCEEDDQVLYHPKAELPMLAIRYFCS